jgi:hypothetical protein
MTGVEGAAAAAAAAAQVIKAWGSVVRVEPQQFLHLVGRQEQPLVIRTRGGFMNRQWHYLTSYRGFVFYAKGPEPLPLPGRAEVFEAKKIWMPA